MSRLFGKDDATTGGPAAPDDGNLRRPLEQLRAFFPDTPGVQITEDHVHSVLSVRRGREALFGKHLFSDPAWDIMLELYAAKLGNRWLSPSELARSIGVQKSVVARWIAALAQAGIVSSSDLDEREETTVELTEKGFNKMAQLAEQWGSAFVAI